MLYNTKLRLSKDLQEPERRTQAQNYVSSVITESWDQITLDYYMFGYMNNMIGLFGAQRETGPGKGLGAEGVTSGVAGKWDR